MYRGYGKIVIISLWNTGIRIPGNTRRNIYRISPRLGSTSYGDVNIILNITRDNRVYRLWVCNDGISRSIYSMRV